MINSTQLNRTVCINNHLFDFIFLKNTYLNPLPHVMNKIKTMVKVCIENMFLALLAYLGTSMVETNKYCSNGELSLVVYEEKPLGLIELNKKTCSNGEISLVVYEEKPIGLVEYNKTYGDYPTWSKDIRSISLITELVYVLIIPESKKKILKNERSEYNDSYNEYDPYDEKNAYDDNYEFQKEYSSKDKFNAIDLESHRTEEKLILIVNSTVNAEEKKKLLSLARFIKILRLSELNNYQSKKPFNNDMFNRYRIFREKWLPKNKKAFLTPSRFPQSIHKKESLNLRELPSISDYIYPVKNRAYFNGQNTSQQYLIIPNTKVNLDMHNFPKLDIKFVIICDDLIKKTGKF